MQCKANGNEVLLAPHWLSDEEASVKVAFAAEGIIRKLGRYDLFLPRAVNWVLSKPGGDLDW